MIQRFGEIPIVLIRCRHNGKQAGQRLLTRQHLAEFHLIFLGELAALADELIRKFHQHFLIARLGAGKRLGIINQAFR